MALHVQYLMPYWNLRDLQSKQHAQAGGQGVRNAIGYAVHVCQNCKASLIPQACGSIARRSRAAWQKMHEVDTTKLVTLSYEKS